ncbi:MAG: translation initiation factor IF-2 [Gemmatimonadota bacterium]|nr:translation initiation factor IF-2 [Gemmatimonadota bacterium]
MSGFRVYKVAKTFDISSDALVKLLEEIGRPVHSHMSTIDEETVELITKALAQAKAAVRRKDEIKQKKFGTAKAKTAKDGRREQPRGSGRAAGKHQPVEKRAEGAPRGWGKKKKKKKKKQVNQKVIAENIRRTLAKMEAGTRKRKRRRTVASEVVEDQGPVNQIKVMEFISLAELSDLIEVTPNKLISSCMELGLMVTVNQRLDFETISLICEEFGFQAVLDEEYGLELLDEDFIGDGEGAGDIRPRAPIVTVMGHVDHGKTTLLDYIRKTNVISGESGGITQHIGAYKVSTDGGTVCFLDTPGHEAFTSMRARGAQVTDIVVLVIAADDSVQPQTLEAINHARAAGVPIIVAVNKIDLPAANPDKVKQELIQHELMVEEFGGKVLCGEISAKNGDGVDHLIELILLQAEMMELTADYGGASRGVVVEAKLDRGMGPVASVLLTSGSLHVGDSFVCGMVAGRVRAIRNERGETLQDEIPGSPVQVLGFDSVPQAGDNFHVVQDEREAKEIANVRQRLKREQDFSRHRKMTLGQLFQRIEAGEVQNLNLIIKGDVDGSVEALSDAMERLSTPEVKIVVIHRGVGAITENDVILASASDAIIIGFHVRPNVKSREVARREGVDIRLYRVIYEVVDDIHLAMEGLLGAEEKEVLQGTVEVRQVYKLSKVGTIAGCYVVEGKVYRNNRARLTRDGVVVWEGELANLKRFKDDAREVASGFECGIRLENFADIKVGDIIESFTIEEVQRKLGVQSS